MRQKVAEGEDPIVASTIISSLLFADKLDEQQLKNFFWDMVPVVSQLRATERFVTALDEGDWNTAFSELLGAGLSAVPWGAAAKAAKKALGTTDDVLEDAGGATLHQGDEALESGTKAADEAPDLRSPSHQEGAQLAEDAKNSLVKLYGEGGDLSNPAYLRPFMEKLKVPKEKWAELEDIFSGKVIPSSAEREVFVALTDFAEGTGFRLMGGKRGMSAQITNKRYAFPDTALHPVDMAPEDFKLFVKDIVANIDQKPFAIIEVKSGTATFSGPQKRLFADLVAAGKGDIFVLYHLPQKKIRAEFFADSVTDYLRRKGVTLDAQELKLVMRLSEEIKRTLPGGAPASDTYMLLLLASATAMGLKYEYFTPQE